MVTNKTYSYKKRLRYSDDRSEYTFQLRKRNYKWLWLLLLLPLLLLFIRCDRDITVTTVDDSTGKPMSGIDVSMAYTAHFLYKDGFFDNEAVERNATTDADGNATFENLPCSVYSYVFYCLSEAFFHAWDDCNVMEPSPQSSLFHYTWHKELRLAPRTVDVVIDVLDRETLEPLADADVEYNYTVNGQEETGTATTDVMGRCRLSDVPKCGIVSLDKVSCYGYADTTNVEIDVEDAYSGENDVLLTPLKQRFSYFVKNKFTREPVPGATVEVILTSSKGRVLRGRSVTNVDGLGCGVYEDAFVLAKVQLNASKEHYKDGQLDGVYTVEQFASLPDERRTIYLEPEPYMEEFRNVDSISGEPIAGVTNVMRVSAINGQKEEFTEVSNRNGVFYVKAMNGDAIAIDSELSPYYEPKHTQIDKFENGETIKMKPRTTSLVFRTIDGETGEVLADCDLAISTSRSHITKPTSSGSGVFEVKDVYVGETISITASKADYTTNYYTVQDDGVLELMNAPQERRDIPLILDLPPCNGGSDGVDASNRHKAIKSFNMGQRSGTFVLEWETYGEPDRLLVYNCSESEIPYNRPIFDNDSVTTSERQYTRIAFSDGPVITVVGTTSTSNEIESSWLYIVNCPD